MFGCSLYSNAFVLPKLTVPGKYLLRGSFQVQLPICMPSAYDSRLLQTLQHSLVVRKCKLDYFRNGDLRAKVGEGFRLNLMRSGKQHKWS